MEKYEVTFYYHTNCVVEVEAKNEEDAIRKARNVSSEEIDRMLLDNLVEDDGPDVEEV